MRLSKDELEELWMQHVGSRALSMEQELEILRWLRKTGEVEFNKLYLLYLSSKWWVQIRREVWRRDRGSCVRCKSKAFVQVDHVKYGRFGEESLDDLQTLCYECHAKRTKKFQLHGGNGPGMWKVDASGQMFGALRRRPERPEVGNATARV